MNLKYKPNIKYIKHDSQFLVIENSGQTMYFKHGLDFNFNLLTNSYDFDANSISVLDFLKKTDLCYETDQTQLKNSDKNTDKKIDKITSKVFQEFFGSDYFKSSPQAQQLIALNLTSISISLDIVSEYMPTKNVSFFDFNEQIASGSIPQQTDLYVVFSEVLNDEKLTLINKIFLKEKIRWLAVHIQQDQIRLGPYFNDTSLNYCYECFVNRLKSKDPLHKIQITNFTKLFQKEFDLFHLNFIQLELIKSFTNYFSDYRRSVKVYSALYSQLGSYPFISYPICSCGSDV